MPEEKPKLKEHYGYNGMPYARIFSYPYLKNQVRIAIDIVAIGKKVYVGDDRGSLDGCIYYGIKPSQIRYGDEPDHPGGER